MSGKFALLWREVDSTKVRTAKPKNMYYICVLKNIYMYIHGYMLCICICICKNTVDIHTGTQQSDIDIDIDNKQ